MITVRNRLNAPLVVNIVDEPALYFMPKEIKNITPEQYNSPEMQENIRAGYILVLRLS